MPNRMIDLAGQQCGRITVVRCVGKRGDTFLWDGVCECGSVKQYTTNNLRGKQKNGQGCGCEQNVDRKLKLSGQRFGKLIAVESYGLSKRGNVVWRCICDCGNETIVESTSLNIGMTKSCGCLVKEKCSKLGASSRIHGMHNDRLYKKWAAMKARCSNPKHPGYKNYGQRGISVCDEWCISFLPFRDWAYSNGYEECLTLDRINVNGNYEPNNCRWISSFEQHSNTRRNVVLEYKDDVDTMANMSRKHGIGVATLKYRLASGMSVVEALETPVRYKAPSQKSGKRGRD